METCDVLVVGGGLIGCAAAWHLARGGAAVVVAEAREINAGASGRNAGSLHFQIERRFLEEEGASEQAARSVALSRLAIADWRGLERALGADLHVAMTGGLMVAETAEDVALLERKTAAERAQGLDVRLIDGDAARAIAPYLAPGILAAAFAPDEGHADPRALVPALAAAAVAAGASLRERTAIVAIERRDGAFAVMMDASEGAVSLRCGQILIAAGIWSAAIAALANLHLPLYPVALQMNVTERSAWPMPHLVQHVGKRLSMKRAHAGNVLIGGGWPSRLARTAGGAFDPGRRPEMLPASLAGNLRVAADVVPEVARLNLIRTWTGATAVSADQLPLAGALPRVPGLYVAAGGSAFTLGPTMARLIARAMAGERQETLELYSPARFDHLNSVMGQP